MQVLSCGNSQQNDNVNSDTILPEDSTNIALNQSLFGDLYNYKNIYFPQLEFIQSLQITDDLTFDSDDLELLCENSNLKQLFLHNLPNLYQIPASIVKLSDLYILSITQCINITTLPLSFRFLTKLKTLRIDYDTYQSLPIFLSFMPSLRLLLLHKIVSICDQCKFYSRKTGRIVILPLFNEYSTYSFDSSITYNTPSLSVLSANSFLQICEKNITLFQELMNKRRLWPVFKENFDLDIDRCTICFKKCQFPNQMFSISFTRFFNCKCIHLDGYICSELCQNQLKSTLLNYHPNNVIITTKESLCFDNFQQRRHFLNHDIRRCIQRTFIRLFACVPLYYKRSYTVTGS